MIHAHHLQAWVGGMGLSRPQPMLRAIVSGALMLAWEELHPGAISAQQGAPGTIDNSAHATDENGSRAHGAGLQCDVQAGILQVPPAQALGSRLQGAKILCC